MSAVTADKPVTAVIGASGPRARAGVESAARRLGLELVIQGPLVLAAPSGTLTTGGGDGLLAWLAGRGVGMAKQGRLQETASQLTVNSTDAPGQPPLIGNYMHVSLNSHTGQVTVAHDHLGAQPVYWVEQGSTTFFGGHIVHVLAMLDRSPSPDRIAVVQWLNVRMLPLGRTLFEGINRLPAGWALTIASGRARATKVWDPALRGPLITDRLEAAEWMSTEAFAAVERASRGLIRPAVQLSGGLDSAAVAAGLRHCRPGERPYALSRSFPGYPDADEAELLRATAAFTGLCLVEVPFDDVPIAQMVDTWVRRWSLPPGTPTYPVWSGLFAEAGRLGIDGLLDGEGGDVTFGSFPFTIADRLARGRWRSAWALAGQLPGVGVPPDPAVRRAVLRRYGASGLIPYRLQRARQAHDSNRPGIGPLVQERDVASLLCAEDRFDWKRGNGPLWWRSAVDTLLNLPERLDVHGELARVSADAALSRRHPLLHDPRLVEAALRISPDLQFDAVRDRPVVRDGLKGHIPEKVRTRYVKGEFTEISMRQILGSDFATLRGRLADPSALVREYASASGIDQALRDAGTSTNQPTRAARLFRLVSVDSWLRHVSGATPNDQDCP